MTLIKNLQLINMNKLTVTIITLNEELKLTKCLESVKFADEIIVVDCGSTDNTVAIAQRYKAKIYNREFDNFEKQKNWAVSKATHDWIFSVDADEVVTSDLAKEIREAIKSNVYDGFLIPRRNFIFGAEIKFTRWSPDRHIWLWRKENGKWLGEVHEEVVVNGSVGELINAKLHYQDTTVAQFIKSNNRYSQLQAEEMVKNGVKFSFLRLFWDAKFEFLLRYVYKLGFLDGWRGFVLSYIMAIYKMMVWVKVWELSRK